MSIYAVFFETKVDFSLDWLYQVIYLYSQWENKKSQSNFKKSSMSWISQNLVSIGPIV